MDQPPVARTFLSGRVRILVGDITAQNVDVIVNAANSTLLGNAVLTSAGALPAKHVIHTVGPIVGGGCEPDSALLAACYRNSLALAAEVQLRSIAFPAISTGAYGYPRDEAAPVVSSTIESFLRKPTSISEVRLVFYDSSDARIFLRHHTFTSE
jgi:O-acetyl-ADP-ribose deacetylase (regulator of RNase III)